MLQKVLENSVVNKEDPNRMLLFLRCLLTLSAPIRTIIIAEKGMNHPVTRRKKLKMTLSTNLRKTEFEDGNEVVHPELRVICAQQRLDH